MGSTKKMKWFLFLPSMRTVVVLWKLHLFVLPVLTLMNFSCYRRFSGRYVCVKFCQSVSHPNAAATGINKNIVVWSGEQKVDAFPTLFDRSGRFQFVTREFWNWRQSCQHSIRLIAKANNSEKEFFLNLVLHFSFDHKSHTHSPSHAIGCAA